MTMPRGEDGEADDAPRVKTQRQRDGSDVGLGLKGGASGCV